MPRGRASSAPINAPANAGLQADMYLPPSSVGATRLNPRNVKPESSTLTVGYSRTVKIPRRICRLPITASISDNSEKQHPPPETLQPPLTHSGNPADDALH
jgi:hypothetical protein